MISTKKKVGFIGFTCCAGCLLEILNLEDEIVDIANEIDIVRFRMAQGDNVSDRGPFDIVFHEGSVSDEEESLDRTSDFSPVIPQMSCLKGSGLATRKSTLLRFSSVQGSLGVSLAEGKTTGMTGHSRLTNWLRSA